jgi:hypothetical protein
MLVEPEPGFRKKVPIFRKSKEKFRNFIEKFRKKEAIFLDFEAMLRKSFENFRINYETMAHFHPIVCLVNENFVLNIEQFVFGRGQLITKIKCWGKNKGWFKKNEH